MQLDLFRWWARLDQLGTFGNPGSRLTLSFAGIRNLTRPFIGGDGRREAT